MTYELVKVHSATNIEVLPTRWYRRKHAEKAQKDLNAAARQKSGGLAAVLTGEGPAKWQVAPSKAVSALLKHAFMLSEMQRIEDEKPAPTVTYEAA